MIAQDDRYYQRRIATSQFTSVISITLVLFLLGFLGMIILHAHKLSDYVKENIGFSIMIREGIRESGILELKKQLDRQYYVKSSEYIPRDLAAERLQDELGEDFIGFLGYNPILPGIELRIKAPYANVDTLDRIERNLLQYPAVKEVFYQKSLVGAINRNVEKISIIVLGFSALMLFIAIVLINNTIRLSIYSKRFIIRSMQLVGATEGFIMKPLLTKSIIQGFISALLALVMLMILVWFAVEQLPELVELQDPVILGGLVLMMFVLGAFISWVSTWLSVKKYLRMRTDLLYT